MPTSPPRQQSLAIVKRNLAICREHFRLILHLPTFPPTEPGQFIQIACRDVEFDEPREDEIDWQPGIRIEIHDPDLLSPHAMLRRPFSLAGRDDTPDGVDLHIIHRVVGVGTDWLAHLKLGDHVSILGPLGNRFTLPPPNHTALLVGGGVGIPPMLYLAERLADRNAVAFCGATTKELLSLTITGDVPTNNQPALCIAEFAQHNIPAIITTDDASVGVGGFVTQALEKWLDSHPSDPTTIYTCGPEPMMKRVAETANQRNLPYQVAVERAMACGMGTCQSCVIRVKKNDSWLYKLACTDGPIFAGADLLW